MNLVRGWQLKMVYLLRDNNHKPLSTLKIFSEIRGRWEKPQKTIMRQYFKNHIQKKVPPKKHEVEEFKTHNKKVFGTIHWVRIKTFVFNEYRAKH